MKEKYFIYLQKKSCTRQFESKLSLRSFAFSLQKKSCTRQFESSFHCARLHFLCRRKEEEKEKIWNKKTTEYNYP
jgi:hypothetical protein